MRKLQIHEDIFCFLKPHFVWQGEKVYSILVFMEKVLFYTPVKSEKSRWKNNTCIFIEVSLLPMFLYAFVFGFCIFVHM